MLRPKAIWFRAAALLLPLLSGCLREDTDHCPEERGLVVKVRDAVTGDDITDSGQVENADLFLFDPDGNFLRRFSVSGEQIANGVPVTIRTSRLEGCVLSVWGNTGEGQRLEELSPGMTIGNRAVGLITAQDGYQGVPDDLFFGLKTIGPRSFSDVVDEVTIVRINARLHLTVKGLDSVTPAGDYYFTVQGPCDGYDFSGNPVRNAASIRRPGVFDAVGDFTTDGAFNLIHTPVTDPGGEVTVNLFHRASGRSGDLLIASVTQDDDGTPIVLPSGMTTNVLIDLRKGTGTEIHIEITPWNEIYQWAEW